MKQVQQKKILKLDGSEEFEIVPEVKKKVSGQKMSFLLTQTSEIGFAIAVPISVGALFGVWLDNKFNSHPKLTLSFLFVGIALAFLGLFSLVRTFTNKKTKQSP